MFQIQKRRTQIGDSFDMAVRAQELLEHPDGKRALVKRAIVTGFKTDSKTFTNLCESDCNENEYLDELVQLCSIVEIPLNKGASKVEIVNRLRQFDKDADTCRNSWPERVALEVAEKSLWRNTNMEDRLRLETQGVYEQNPDYRESDRDEESRIENFMSLYRKQNRHIGLTWDGKLKGWGYYTQIPKTDKRCVAISLGWSALALTEDGQIVSSDWHPLPAFEKRATAISKNGVSVALFEDGTIQMWSDHFYCKPKSNERFTAVGSGGEHVLAISERGKVFWWRLCNHRRWRTGRVPPIRQRVVAISVDSDNAFALLQDGSVVGWRMDDNNLFTVASDKRFIAIHINNSNFYAMVEDGTIVKDSLFFLTKRLAVLSDIRMTGSGVVHAIFTSFQKKID